MEEDGGDYPIDLLPGGVRDPVRARADVAEHLERAVAISSSVSGGAFLLCRSLGGVQNSSFGGKKWFNRTSFIC